MKWLIVKKEMKYIFCYFRDRKPSQQLRVAENKTGLETKLKTKNGVEFCSPALTL